ncbi:MAG: acyl-CoA dehydrogenase family protein [Spirochaetota bacterium]|nr:acyl-CoA dehydrogenase family protein [Spirochaetota bacterium]
MVTALKKEHIAIKERIAAFADNVIAPLQELNTMSNFPYDIWQKMSEDGLLGLSLPISYGGSWYDYLSIVIALEKLVNNGHNLGLAYTLMMHLIISRFFFLENGKDEHHQSYLKDLASGSITAAIAASEPGTGTNPKYMKTTAKRQGNNFILNGKKGFISNGPIADILVVFAISGTIQGKNSISAFIVPKETTGLTKTKPIELNYLHPSQHCGITLKNCSVPASNILGSEGSANQDMIKPFRIVEETLTMGAVIGGMEYQMELVVSLIRQQGRNKSNELLEDIGRLKYILHAIRVLSYEAAKILEDDISHPELPPLILSSRFLADTFQSQLKKISQDHCVNYEDIKIETITHDLLQSLKLGKDVLRIKQRKIAEQYF